MNYLGQEKTLVIIYLDTFISKEGKGQRNQVTCPKWFSSFFDGGASLLTPQASIC
jgi:hypothetical protein